MSKKRTVVGVLNETASRHLSEETVFARYAVHHARCIASTATCHAHASLVIGRLKVLHSSDVRFVIATAMSCQTLDK